MPGGLDRHGLPGAGRGGPHVRAVQARRSEGGGQRLAHLRHDVLPGLQRLHRGDLARGEGRDRDRGAVPHVRRERRSSRSSRRPTAAGAPTAASPTSWPRPTRTTGSSRAPRTGATPGPRTSPPRPIQAAYPTLGTLQRIVVTARVDHGEWGGRVTVGAPRGLQGGRDGERDRAALRPRAEERVVPRPAGRAGTASRRGPDAAPGAGRVNAPSKVVRDRQVPRRPRRGPHAGRHRSDAGSSAVTGYQRHRVARRPGDQRGRRPPVEVTVDGLVNGSVVLPRGRREERVGSSTSVPTAVTPASTFGYQVSVPSTSVLSGRARRVDPARRHGAREGRCARRRRSAP